MMLGHADLETTTVYLHLSRRHLQSTPQPTRADQPAESHATDALSEEAETRMTGPAVEVADILREQGDHFLEQSPWLNVQQLSVLRAITRCRTAALGGHIDASLYESSIEGESSVFRADGRTQES